MPILDPQRRKTDNSPAKITGHRCLHCGQDLRFVRKHVSPARLGAPRSTEFYQCRACDAGYAFNRSEGKWKAWVGDDEY